MMTNTGPYSPRMNQMSTSSMYFPSQYPESRASTGFISAATTYDPFQKPIETIKVQEQTNTVFPRGLTHQSMIDMNSTSTGRRSAFGKLDSMARKVTPTFQEDSLNEIKKVNQTPSTTYDNSAHSMIGPNPNFIKHFNSLGQGYELNHNSHHFPATNEVVPKKRRESIDLGVASKRQSNFETLPFMRRAKGTEQIKTQNPMDTQINGADNVKTKNFQFLKKRRQALQNQQSTTASTIIGVQSMKNLYPLSNNQPVLKKSQFSTPPHTYHKYAPPVMSPVQCPQDKPKNQIATKDQVHGKFSNFQFKKKKQFQSPAEPMSAKPAFSKDLFNQKVTTMTIKEKFAMKNHRQIKVQDFDFIQKLGKGAFGDVYIAQEKAIGFICVIKKMSKKRIRQAQVEEHILRQIKIQSYLHNQHITALFGCFHDEDNLYLVLEALPDGSLQNVKKKKKLPEKQTAAIVKQVADGLKFMHEQYLIHRDLKPQNLFMNEGFVKIGDFGCSIYNRDLGLRNTVVGCLQYSSPEQLSREGYSEKIDSWSLGILTYELLFGKSPFESDIIKMARNREMKGELSTLNFPAGIHIKQETKRFIENLLAEDPDMRMDMDQVLNHEFLRQQVNKKPIKMQQL